MCLLRRNELVDKLSYTKRQLRDQLTNIIINNIDVVSDTGAFTPKIILDHCSSSVLHVIDKRMSMRGVQSKEYRACE